MKFDKSIPIPEPRLGGGKNSKWAFMSDMEIGDSFLLIGKSVSERESQRTQVWSYANSIGIKLVTRSVEGGIRVGEFLKVTHVNKYTDDRGRPMNEKNTVLSVVRFVLWYACAIVASVFLVLIAAGVLKYPLPSILLFVASILVLIAAAIIAIYDLKDFLDNDDKFRD